MHKPRKLWRFNIKLCLKEFHKSNFLFVNFYLVIVLAQLQLVGESKSKVII